MEIFENTMSYMLTPHLNNSKVLVKIFYPVTLAWTTSKHEDWNRRFDYHKIHGILEYLHAMLLDKRGDTLTKAARIFTISIREVKNAMGLKDRMTSDQQGLIK